MHGPTARITRQTVSDLGADETRRRFQFLDTCELYGAILTDGLLRIAESGAFRPFWAGDAPRSRPNL